MVEVPKEFLVFRDFSKPQTEKLLTEPSRELIKEVLKLGSDEKEEIMTDFNANNLEFCRKENFTLEKTSCLLSIFYYTLTQSIQNRVSCETSFELFKNLLLKHSVQRSPYSIAVFTLAEVKTITDFALTTLYAHYSLYEFAFTPHSDLVLKTVELFESRFPATLNLAEGEEVSPESIEALQEYIVYEKEEEPAAQELPQEEEESDDPDDPVQQYLNNELKNLKTEMEERMKKQDEDFLAKIEAIKR